MESGISVKTRTTTMEHQAASRTESLNQSILRIITPIAILPQYLATQITKLTTWGVNFPQFSDPFTVSNGIEDLFGVQREHPAISRCQYIANSTTNAPVKTIGRNMGQFPISYRCEDLAGAKVLDFRGHFFLPYSGAKSSAFLLSSATSDKIELVTCGNYRSRHATVTDEAMGEVLVDMRSNIFEARNVVSGRRTYEVTARAMVDLALAVAVIVALDARAE